MPHFVTLIITFTTKASKKRKFQHILHSTSSSRGIGMSSWVNFDITVVSIATVSISKRRVEIIGATSANPVFKELFILTLGPIFILQSFAVFFLISTQDWDVVVGVVVFGILVILEPSFPQLLLGVFR